MLLITLLIIRYYIRRAMVIPEQLYKEALKHENNGLFREAQLGYMYAMEEIKRKKGIQQSPRLKELITEKLKVLQSVISYNKVVPAIV